MNIEKIQLTNFRNYISQEIVLDKGINIFCGQNGEGKTNIIEAVYMCAIGKSFRTRRDKETIRFGETLAKIETKYEKKDRKGEIKLNISDKKSVYLNNVQINKLSDFIGNINVVLFNPNDIYILKNGPGERRRFLDIMISQLRPIYTHNLSQYIKILEQRNTYLRQMKYENKSEELLEVWDEKLINTGSIISEYRREFIEKIKNKINIIHEKITNNREKIEINYITNINDIIDRKKDVEKGYTTVGIHRDDIEIKINEKNIGTYGSQGQNRTAVLSLKLSELEIVRDEIEEYPILLLDDFVSELDSVRKNNVLENIREHQVIITCTDKLNLDNAKIFNVKAR